MSKRRGNIVSLDTCRARPLKKCVHSSLGREMLAEQTRVQFDDAIGAAGYFDFNGNWVRFYP